MNYQFSLHAIEEMANRQIPQEIIEQVLDNPLQVIPQNPDKQIFQSIISMKNEGIDKDYVIRVIVNIVKEPNLVVTVYRSSKISKYIL